MSALKTCWNDARKKTQDMNSKIVAMEALNTFLSTCACFLCAQTFWNAASDHWRQDLSFDENWNSKWLSFFIRDHTSGLKYKYRISEIQLFIFSFIDIAI